jgi:hypothetical protein
VIVGAGLLCERMRVREQDMAFPCRSFLLFYLLWKATDGYRIVGATTTAGVFHVLDLELLLFSAHYYEEA